MEMDISMPFLWVLAFLSPAVYVIWLYRFNSLKMVFIGLLLSLILRFPMSFAIHGNYYILLLALMMMLMGSLLPIVLLFFWNETRMNPNSSILGLRGLVGSISLAIAIDLVLRTHGNTFDMSIYGIPGYKWVGSIIVIVLIGIPLLLSYLSLKGQIFSFPSEKKLIKNEIREYLPIRHNLLIGLSTGIMFYLYLSLLGFPNRLARWTNDMDYQGTAMCFAVFALLPLLIILVKRIPWSVIKKLNFVGAIYILLVYLNLLYWKTPMITTLTAASLLTFIPLLLGINFIRTLNTASDRRDIARTFVIAQVVVLIHVFFDVGSLVAGQVDIFGFLEGRFNSVIITPVIIMALCEIVLLQVYRNKTKNCWTKRLKTEIKRFSKGTTTTILIIFCILLLLLLSGSISYPKKTLQNEEAKDEITVVTYNIHQGFDMDYRISPEEIIAPLKKVRPDILVLQESDTNRISSTNVDMISYLSHNLDMFPYFGPSTDMQIYGVSLLSRYPISNRSVTKLTSIEDQRVLIHGDITIGKNVISVYGVHMGLIDEDRTTQTKEVIEILEKDDKPLILMGDLNSKPQSSQINIYLKELGDAWTLSGKDNMDPKGYSYEAAEPDRRIDYILLSEDRGLEVLEAGVMDEYLGSDHLAVWAKIKLENSVI